jgi:Protein of unknown function (DUF3616)
MIGRMLTAAGAIGLTFAVSGAGAFEYKGLCEASAGAFLDDRHFVVASDETNLLQLYERGKADPIGDGIDMRKFLSFKKSDLEAAAVVGDRVYWMSSHSLTGKGNDKDERKVFFATTIGSAGGKPTLTPVGTGPADLRDALLEAAGVKKKQINVEALAATPTGELLIGLRGPLRDELALVVPFRNPAAVAEKGAAPDFGEAVAIDLGGLGLRSMDLIPGGGARYVIVAGPVSDADGFAVFRWGGPGTAPKKIDGLDLDGLRPEGAMVIPGTNRVQLLSDDGDICSDEDDEKKRRFRSIDIELKE